MRPIHSCLRSVPLNDVSASESVIALAYLAAAGDPSVADGQARHVCVGDGLASAAVEVEAEAHGKAAVVERLG